MTNYWVISGNNPVFYGQYERALSVRNGLIQAHKAALHEGSWHAYFEPEKHIILTEGFSPTNQPLWGINAFWLFCENDQAAASLIDAEREYVCSKRRTPQGRIRFAKDRAGIFARKTYSSFYTEMDKQGLAKEFREVFNERMFSIVFAEQLLDVHLMDHKLALIEKTQKYFAGPHDREFFKQQK